MNKRERDELTSRNFWDSCHADHLMSVMKFGLRSNTWRQEMIEAHFYLVYHFAHDENDSLDFYVRHKIGDTARCELDRLNGRACGTVWQVPA